MNLPGWGTLLLGVAAALVIAASVDAATVQPPVQVGTLTPGNLTEVSGIVGGHPSDTLWVHNDSGDSARFYAISPSGTLLGTFLLAGAGAVDWEDMAIGPKPGGGSYLYFGDIGDNNADRAEIAVYRVTEPQSTTGATIAAVDQAVARLQYPGGARNAESLLVDPQTGELFIITKGAAPRCTALRPALSTIRRR